MAKATHATIVDSPDDGGFYAYTWSISTGERVAESEVFATHDEALKWAESQGAIEIKDCV